MQAVTAGLALGFAPTGRPALQHARASMPSMGPVHDAKAAAKVAKGGAVASTPAKTSLDGAVGAEARVAKVSPIKSLFERAAAANLKSASPGGPIAAAPEGEDGKQ